MLIQKYLAELVGTFALVFFGAGAAIMSSDIVAVALTFGFVALAMVYVFGGISGAHINPAVTIALLFDKKINFSSAIGYIVFQLFGAFLAALVLELTIASDKLVEQGVTVLSSGISPLQGFFIEVILTALLVLVVLAFIRQDGGKPIVGGAVIGLVIALDILMAGGLTGASMNPARTFGPALVSGLWTDHWVYWAGPIIGGLVALAISKIWRAK